MCIAMKKVVGLLATVAVIGVIVMTLLNNKAKSDAKVASQKEVMSAIPVTVTKVTTGAIEDALSLTGTVAAANDVVVVSETSGRVKSVFVKIGDKVQSGSGLVQVDDELRQAALLSAQANYDKAKADFERTESLFKEQAVAQAQLDAAKLGFKAAEAQLITARRQVRDTRITSPISGIVTAFQTSVGMMLQPGTPVATVVDVSSLKVKVNVAEADVFKLKQGDKAEITTEVYPGVKFEGRINSISVKGDEAHTYPVEITLPNNPQRPLKAGMFARVAFVSVQPSVHPLVPREALVGSVKDAKVFVVQNNVAHLRPITVGTEAEGKIVVLNGLQAGEQVVSNGQGNLKEGTEVKIVQ